MPVTKEISAYVLMSKELLCGLRRGVNTGQRSGNKQGDGESRRLQAKIRRNERSRSEVGEYQQRLMHKSAVPIFHPTCTSTFICVPLFGLICVSSRATAETDNVIYLLSSCLFDKIRRSMLLWRHKRLRACMYVCAQKIS